jgi:S1-C subfamily serine protease
MKKVVLVTLLMTVALLIGLGLGTLAAPAISATSVVSGSAANTSTRLPVSAPIVNPVQPAAAAPGAVIDEQATIEGLYARENPSVVNITIYGQQGRQVAALGEGSGFVFDASGDIVTNAHVVQHADQLEVTFSDGTVLAAKIVGQDLNSDLAVVKVDQLPANAQPLALAQMSDLAVGETVVAIGNPFGLDGSISKGIISALGRNISSLTSFSIPEAIQTDAAINPGNSGGPLLDLAGHVVGVNAQIATGGTSSSNSGVGFAIPVNIVSKVIPELIKNGKYDWAWLGIRGGNVTPSLVDAMKLPVNRGAYVVEASAGGPAAQAGLRGAGTSSTVNGRAVQTGGDVITAINGQPVNAFDDLLIYIALQTQPGQDVTLSIVRDGQSQDVKLRLGSRPAAVALAQPSATQSAS